MPYQYQYTWAAQQAAHHRGENWFQNAEAQPLGQQLNIKRQQGHCTKGLDGEPGAESQISEDVKRQVDREQHGAEWPPRLVVQQKRQAGSSPSEQADRSEHHHPQRNEQRADQQALQIFETGVWWRQWNRRVNFIHDCVDRPRPLR
jgi:hypothetical protein